MAKIKKIIMKKAEGTGKKSIGGKDKKTQEYVPAKAYHSKRESIAITFVTCILLYVVLIAVQLNLFISENWPKELLLFMIMTTILIIGAYAHFKSAYLAVRSIRTNWDVAICLFILFAYFYCAVFAFTNRASFSWALGLFVLLLLLIRMVRCKNVPA